MDCFDKKKQRRAHGNVVASEAFSRIVFGLFFFLLFSVPSLFHFPLLSFHPAHPPICIYHFDCERGSDLSVIRMIIHQFSHFFVSKFSLTFRSVFVFVCFKITAVLFHVSNLLCFFVFEYVFVLLCLCVVNFLPFSSIFSVYSQWNIKTRDTTSECTPIPPSKSVFHGNTTVSSPLSFWRIICVGWNSDTIGAGNSLSNSPANS